MSATALRLTKTKTPGVYSRGGRYVVRFRDPSGKQRKRFAKTYKEAVRLKSALATDVDRGEYREQSRVRFADYAAEWSETYQGRTSRGIREQTRSDYRSLLERDATPFFGRYRLAEIEPRDVKAFVSQLAARGLEPTSIRKVLAPVRALFATAVEEGLIRSNPAAGVRVAMPENSDDEATGAGVKALSEAELVAVLERVPSEWRLFFNFLAQSGLRIGEAVELRWSDIDLGQGTLRVRRRFYRGHVDAPKSRYGKRQLRLSPALARALWELRKESRAADDELVFTAERGGRVDTSNLMSRVLKPAAVETGLGEWVMTKNGRRADTWVGFHTFRHTCATILFGRGWNAVQVQRWLGHHSPSFTLDRYVGLLDEDVPEPTFFDDVASAWGSESARSSETAVRLPRRARRPA
jgi:integrase